MLAAPADEDDEDTSFSRTPSLSLVLVNLDEGRSDSRVLLLPSCTVEDELIREELSLTLSLPERRPEEEEEEEEEEGGFLVCGMGLVILKDDEAEVDGEMTSDTIVLSLEVPRLTRVDGFAVPTGSRMFVVVDGFWSSRENTEDTCT